MQKTDELVNTLVKAVSDIQNKKAKGYDTQAQVTRIEGNTAYVHIPGGVDETPAQLTINAKKGDQVRVRVAGGTAWLVGNASNPPTDDATANAASAVANTASAMAGEAIESANIAQEAAESAQASAAEAKASAIEANNHANSALTQLGFVEDVVDTLNWITAHGIYIETTDTEPVDGKYYFTATEVSSPSGNPREQNYFEYNSTTQKYVLSTDTTVTSGKTYYTIAQVTTTITDPTGYLELNSVDKAVADYVQSHLALTDEGLYVVKDNQGYKILLANDGMKVYDNTGALVATYGENITFSATRPQTIGGVSSYIKYLQENGQWKIKVVADVIEFTGGESVASTSNVSAAQAAAISTAAADATTKADAAQAAAVSTAAADATTKANDAKKVATNFLTSVSSNNGVQIHAVNNASQNYAQIDANGMNIYKGGTSVAQYGDSIRLGKTNIGHVIMSDTEMVFYNNADTVGSIGYGIASNKSECSFLTSYDETYYAGMTGSVGSSAATLVLEAYQTYNPKITIDGAANTISFSSNSVTMGSLTLTNTLNSLGIGGKSGDWWGKIPTVQSANGVMEVGRYIDFHISNTGTSDYDLRLTANSGNLTMSGTLIVQGHSTAIGSILNAHLASNKSISANTFTMLTSLTLPAGTWQCVCGVRFSASTGEKVCNLQAVSANGAYYVSSTLPAQNGLVNINFTKVLTVTSNTTYYLNAKSAAATTVYSGGEDSDKAGYGTYITAVRIA